MTQVIDRRATRFSRGAAVSLQARAGAGLRALVEQLAALPIYGLFILLIGLPLATVLAQAIMPGLFNINAPSLALDLSPLVGAFGSPRTLGSILNSIELGGIVAVTATTLGGVFAVISQRFRLPLRGLIGPVPWLVFLTPGYLKALAWVLLMAPGGYLAQLGLLPRWASDGFFGIGGLVFVHTVSLFPLSSFIIGGALAGLGSDLEDAARLGGAGPVRIWAGVMLPLLLPAIVLSMIATFAEVLSDFGLAATIAHTAGFGVLTYGIYVAASDYPLDLPMAGAQALILLTLILVVVVGDRLLRRQAPIKLISGRSRGFKTRHGGALGWVVAAVMIAIAVLALYLPLLAVMLRTITSSLGHGLEPSNFTLANLADTLSWNAPGNAALLRSLGYASVAATIAAAVALLLSARLDGASVGAQTLVTGLSMGAIAIPGIVLGFGYILVWNRLPGFSSWPLPRYGQASLLVTGYVAAALPYCLIVILSAVRQLAPSLSDAARLHGVGRLGRLVGITLPLVLLSVMTAFLLTFIRTIFELPISQLLIPVTGSPVPPYVVRLLNHDSDGPAASLSLVSMLVAGGIAGLIWLMARRFLTFGVPADGGEVNS